jgi:hypothetical protein
LRQQSERTRRTPVSLAGKHQNCVSLLRFINYQKHARTRHDPEQQQDENYKSYGAHTAPSKIWHWHFAVFIIISPPQESTVCGI